MKLKHFLAECDVPESLEFDSVIPNPVAPSADVRIKGTLQAGNETAIFLLVDSILLKISSSVISGIRKLKGESEHAVEVFLDPDAHFEARTQLILGAEEDGLPLALQEFGLHIGERSTARIQRDERSLAKLARIIDVRTSVGDTDGGIPTSCYLSSATSKPDGGSDSDPMREMDD